MENIPIFQDSKAEFTKIGVSFYFQVFCKCYSNVHGESCHSYKLTLIVMIIIQNRQNSAIVPDVRKWPQTKVAVTGSLSRKKHTDKKKVYILPSFSHRCTSWWFAHKGVEVLCEMMGDKDFPAFTEVGCICGYSVQNDSCKFMSHRYRWRITVLISPSFSQLSNPQS